MAVHELVTNAVNQVRCTVKRHQPRPDRLDGFRRANRFPASTLKDGGPPVQPTPRKGFDPRLIDASLVKSDVVFALEGVSCIFEISFSRALRDPRLGTSAMLRAPEIGG